MIPKTLIDILVKFGFDCKIEKCKVTINRIELPNCKKSYNYFDLITSFKRDDIFATFCTYDYKNEFRQQMKDFIIKEDRERKLKDILNDTI